MMNFLSKVPRMVSEEYQSLISDRLQTMGTNKQNGHQTPYKIKIKDPKH
jgi:hypothetical protein